MLVFYIFTNNTSSNDLIVYKIIGHLQSSIPFIDFFLWNIYIKITTNFIFLLNINVPLAIVKRVPRGPKIEVMPCK